MMSPSPTNIDTKPTEAVPAKAELRSIDCKAPEQWARWRRERAERDNPFGYEGRRY